MQLNQLTKSYKSVAVSTATPGQLVLMLFDGALRFMATANYGFQVEAVTTRNELIHNNLIKTQNILRELQCSLDLKGGGEFADRMFAIYEFMVDQLRLANATKDQGPIAVVEKLLGEIREAWAQMLEQSTERAA